MASFFSYERKNIKLWGVKGYLGYDEMTGKQININKRGFKTRKEAKAYFDRETVAFQTGINNRLTDNRTYGEVYQEWIVQYRNTVKESTAVKTEELFNRHVLPIFAPYRIRKISSHFLQKQLNEWHKSFAMYRKVFNYTCKVFQYAVNMGYISANPKARIIMPRKEIDYKTTVSDKRTKDFYTREELKSLLNAMKSMTTKKWLTFFRLLAFTGIRRGEALALTWNDINFNNSTISINKTLAHGEKRKLIIQSPKSKASKRVISLDTQTIDLLKEWRTEQAKIMLQFGYNTLRPKQLIFSKFETNTFLDLSTPRNALSRICVKHNLPMINIHGFRYTHCSLLLDAGVPMHEVKERLGHSDIKMTMNVYARVSKETKENSANLFAKYVNF
ncbi:MAG: tyrosine-type recombinase/integrase [Aerococcaceae bacterium]|nr:tyrosine-type recombinase/integrase [Aerococcaceae bacterium]